MSSPDQLDNSNPFNIYSDFLDIYESYHLTGLRKQALERIYEHVCADDQFTKCISIGPVSSVKCEFV